MSKHRDEPLLLTPGPLTTSSTVKAAMLRDWGSRDADFIAMNRRVCERLCALATASDTHVTVPVQGSGTFAVEAMLGTFVAPGGRVLILINGAYGKRMADICRIIGRDVVICETAEKDGQWRFTPPTHVIAALDRALDEHAAEGGVAGRHARYAKNCRVLVEGMRALGFRSLLGDNLQAPIIVTFHMPSHPKFNFTRFYDALKDDGFLIYPGKLAKADSFRIGCIGDLDHSDMRAVLVAVKAALETMDVDLSATAPAKF